MKRTYITNVPDRAGAFLRAGEIIAAHGGNISRINYNKAVDLHTLFLDVCAPEARMEDITCELREIGYLPDGSAENRVMLIVLHLPDEPGALLPVLRVLDRYDINISYLNSQENGTGWQDFHMGLLIERSGVARELLDELSRICEVRIQAHNAFDKLLDGTVFYVNFANEMRKLLGLSQKQTNAVLIDSNRIMQMLDERGGSPLKTFDYIRRFARFVADHHGAAFRPVTAKRRVSPRVTVRILEPPCGSNTYLLDDGTELLLVDGGFRCYLEEMRRILYEMYPDFDRRKKRLALTHADIDHDGLIPLFDEVLVSENCRLNFELECEGKDNFREQNPLHAPFCRLSKILSDYTPPELSRLRVLGEKTDDAVLSPIGTLEFADLHFELLEGNGGHVRGETILFCRESRLIFTGDNLVNIRGFSPEQRAFNSLAPYLMTSVNVDSEKATACRELLEQMSAGCLICPGHGMWELPEENEGSERSL